MRMISKTLLATLLIVVVTRAGAARQAEEDEAQVRQWNAFADKLLALHHAQLARHEVYEEERVSGYHGAYFNDPGYYREVSYRDKVNRRLLSRVRWISAEPHKVHTIEVNVFDEDGTLQRDYLAAYLPWGRNAPVQTLVNLHTYNNDLHSFRQYDASGKLIMEQCSGELGGMPVQFSLEDYEIPASETEKSSEYRACFDGAAGNSAGYHRRPM